ncbi:MAG TPA: AMP-binding protein, partial [Actinotalea sp.]|nr:AMP-binding protein [Actinotalea sp.]
ADRDVWWHEALGESPDTHEPEAFDAEHPLFVIYTSGTTGRPKGLVHTVGGYLTQAAWTHWAAFDARPDDVHWCTADLAWVTAHTYVLYGPLANGTTQVLYEDAPDVPSPTRHLEIIERYGVAVYYTAPTLIRAFMGWFGERLPDGFDLSSVRLLGSVGEAINPEVWTWFRNTFGRASTPVVDTWWQSETGAAVVAPLPGASTLKPGSATRALPGLSVRVVDDAGEDVPPGGSGLLVIDRPWPGMARTVWGDPERYLGAYWTRFADRGWFVAGDGARLDEDGDLWLLGRVDDVVNVSGHRLSSVEVESALVAHPAVVEAGVTGVPDPVSGEALVAFVVPAAPPPTAAHAEGWAVLTDELGQALRRQVAAAIGPVARPSRVVVVPDLPKTRSGKILRRLLGQLLVGEELGDTTSLTDPGSVTRIAAVLRAIDTPASPSRLEEIA